MELAEPNNVVRPSRGLLADRECLGIEWQLGRRQRPSRAADSVPSGVGRLASVRGGGDGRTVAPVPCSLGERQRAATRRQSDRQGIEIADVAGWDAGQGEGTLTGAAEGPVWSIAMSGVCRGPAGGGDKARES